MAAVTAALIRAFAKILTRKKGISIITVRKTALLILEFLCRPEDRDGCIGDLLEACEDIEKKHGKRAATAYFWWQFARSVVEFIWAGIKRWGLAAAVLGALGWITRKFSS